jgi:hypothetical protein
VDFRSKGKTPCGSAGIMLAYLEQDGCPMDIVQWRNCSIAGDAE